MLNPHLLEEHNASINGAREPPHFPDSDAACLEAAFEWLRRDVPASSERCARPRVGVPGGHQPSWDHPYLELLYGFTVRALS